MYIIDAAQIVEIDLCTLPYIYLNCESKSNLRILIKGCRL
ncbi:19644_t:CDS:2 [Funneliformis geosporum]|uniref:19644_t:CDS:1 n=1 Tax=Funneliformis geosporum TaxID=1117311 RepID=A0A9W4SMV6_9GLOM|nr:19644_t:CDS:2 [Funneliformis geosporum]